jgi:branched-chain amino acid transport system permease protein
LWAVAVLAILTLLSWTLSDFSLFIATKLMVFAIAILGLDIVFGRAGQLSLMQAGFMGLGAYTAVVLGGEKGNVYADGTSSAASLSTELGVAILIAIIAGVIVGIPSLRVTGLRLVIVTLSFLELFQWFIRVVPEITGGTRGLPVPPAHQFGYTFSNQRGYFWLVAGFAIVATLVVYQLERTGMGRAMLAVRESEYAASSVGISLRKVKLTAFTLSAIYGTVAGVLYSHLSQSISPIQFDLFKSVDLLVAVVIGGASSVAGPWLGAGYLILAPEFFARIGYPNLFRIVSGILLILVLLLAPRGLRDLGLRAFRRIRTLTTNDSKSEIANDG